MKGGIWGFGIGRSICDAYGWLIKCYQPGDKIYLVGFSRGAFTVRSLAGMIGCRGLNCSLAELKGNAYREGVANEFKAYRAEDAIAKPTPKVHFVGVFDTVGRLGVPDNRKIANLFDHPRKWAFHDTQLGSHVIHGRHAIAIDECLADFMPTLWVSEKGHPIYNFKQGRRTVKQFWFCGHHSDIGGGANQPTTNTTLYWMLREARRCGLDIDNDALRSLRRDATALLSKSKWSPMPKMPRGVPLLVSRQVNKKIHISVVERRDAYFPYWPTQVLKAVPMTFAVRTGKGRNWQLAGIWLSKGRTYVARTSGRRGGNNIVGYVANGGNPKIDGTCPKHQEFPLNSYFKVSKSGYVYFRMLRQPYSRRKGKRKLMWRKLRVTLSRDG